jgi:hypothetical protein
MRNIGKIETEIVQLTIYECECGYHIGLDATYCDQVEPANILCPSCGLRFVEPKE